MNHVLVFVGRDILETGSWTYFLKCGLEILLIFLFKLPILWDGIISEQRTNEKGKHIEKEKSERGATKRRKMERAWLEILMTTS